MPSYPGTALWPAATGYYPASGGEVVPGVTTGTASGISYFSATLNGTVDPNGLTTHYAFDYGPTGAYGSRTPEVNLGTIGTVVNDLVSGLTDATLYHFRILAWNGAGTAYGSDQTFTTTDALVPTVTTGTATGITSTGVTLPGSVNPNGLTTAWYFEYDGSQSDGWILTPGTVVQAVSETLDSLAEGTYYRYRIVAFSDAGFAYGDWEAFRTLPGRYGPKVRSYIHEAQRVQ